jgi:N-acetylglutamate synthase-like GNAT family acetyltransferase
LSIGGTIFFVKRIRTLIPPPLVKESPSKPAAKLSKDNPDFFRKLGTISATKRSLPVQTFKDMAYKSHPRRKNAKA